MAWIAMCDLTAPSRILADPLHYPAAPLNLAGPHRQKRLGSVKRLHLAFLIDAQHDSALGRRQIKPYNIAHFLNEERIG